MQNEKPVYVCVIDDDPEILESLTVLINRYESYTCAHSFSSCDATIEQLNDAPDVFLVDIEMPGTNGIEGVRILKNKFPQSEFIMLTIRDDYEFVFKALCAGANGYLLKNSPTSKIIGAISEVLNGGSPMNREIARMVVGSFHQKIPDNNKIFTTRELEILQKLCDGHSYKMIAAELFIDINTVKFHIKNIYLKLQVNSKGEAVAMAIRTKLV